MLILTGTLIPDSASSDQLCAKITQYINVCYDINISVLLILKEKLQCTKWHAGNTTTFNDKASTT